MRIYDHAELDRFRQYAADEYGIDDLPANDRAISARIANISILCGRGVYRPSKKRYFSSDLESRILDFIENEQRGILPVSAIFSTFEKELVSEGIDNRYYLQGILHEKYGDKFYFKRDYIMKDATISSFYDEIIRYIRMSPVQVSKRELYDVFKVSDITISIAASDPSIINYYGSYLYGGNLSIDGPEEKALEEYLEIVLSDHVEHHIQEIFEVIKEDQSSFCGRNGIFYSYQMFSVLQYLFAEQYQFSRPYIALNDVVIGRADERIRELVYDSDEIELDDVFDYAKENHYYIYSKLDFANSLINTHVFKNKDVLIRLTETGFDESEIPVIEDMILSELSGNNKLIGDLECVYRFKSIMIPWNEWFIYSCPRLIARISKR